MESETDSEEDLVEKLVYATAARNVREVEHLMQAGIDPSTPSKRNGCSPLHTAAVLESPSGPEIVSRMLYYGANPDVKTPTGLSALHIAAMWGRYQTINVLLDNGADVADKDEDDMSPLDYAEEAEKHKAQCIDALTRYRLNSKRRSRCFLTKSRPNLNKIMGGHVEFSTFLSEHSHSTNSESLSQPGCAISHYEKNEEGSKRNDDEINRQDSNEDIDDIMTDVQNISISTFTGGRVHPNSARSRYPHFEKEVIGGDSPNETLFQSCNENISLNIAQSTLLEDLHLSDDLSFVLKESNSSINNHTASTANGYSGDISQHNPDGSSSSSASMNETFWSVRTAPGLSSGTAGESDENKENRHSNKQQRISSRNNTVCPSTRIKYEESVLPPLKRRVRKSKLFVPLSPSYNVNRRCNETMEIIGSPRQQKTSKEEEVCDDKQQRKENNKASSLNHNQNSKREDSPSSNNVENDNKEESLNHTQNGGCAGSPSSNEVKNNKEENLHIQNGGCDGSPSCSNEEENLSFDLLAAEETVNYSSNRSVPELIEYYEDSCVVDEFDPREVTLSESPTKGAAPKSPRFVVLNCREHELPAHQRRSIDELSTITISYDWKDVSQLKATEEPEDTTVIVPTSIQILTNIELRERLLGYGEKPGPISESTKKVYQRHLARIEASAGAGGGSGNQKNKEATSDLRLNDYTQEMRQVLLGVNTVSRQRGEELETEMAFTFDKPEKHTWREGTQKTSFNYILLDPRVSNNLPDRSESMSLLEQFNVFAAAIFYIGKGKKSRPYEHFHEAVKFEKKENKTKIASNKINMILDIWNSGYGVATVHTFHSVIPVEAYTREACMIEAMNLSRLTNAKRGDFYGPASSWLVKKKRQLGIYLLMKAMKIYLIEGEKQIKQRDIVK